MGLWTISTEEVSELEQLVEKEKAAAKHGEAAVARNDASQEAEVDAKLKAKAAEDEPPADDTDADTGDTPPPGDDEEDPDADPSEPTDANPPSEDDDEEDDTKSGAGEEQKEIKADAGDATVEDTEALEGFGETILQAGSQALSSIGDGLTYLFKMGVQQAPGLLHNLYRGVLYLSVRTAKFMFRSGVALEKFIARYTQSFGKLRSDIKLLRGSIDELKKKQTKIDPEQLYSKEKVINGLKINDSMDFAANMAVYDQFLKDVIKQIDQSVSTDIAVLKHLLQIAGTAQARDAYPTAKLGTGFKPGLIEGYELKSEFVEGFSYGKKLPGDTVFMTMQPLAQLNSIDSFSKAVEASAFFFGVDAKGFVNVEAMKIKSLDEVSIFLDKLEAVCNTCEQHQTLYQKVIHQKSALKGNFRTYFDRLVASDSKVGIQASLGQNIYLTNAYVDQVFVVGAMDVHDFTIKLLTKGLTFAKDQLSYY